MRSIAQFAALALACLGCGTSYDQPSVLDAVGDASAPRDGAEFGDARIPVDAAPDVPVTPTCANSPFDTPRIFTELDSNNPTEARFSIDERTAVFSKLTNGTTNRKLFIATRASTTATFGAPREMVEILFSASSDYSYPFLSDDQSLVFFETNEFTDKRVQTAFNRRSSPGVYSDGAAPFIDVPGPTLQPYFLSAQNILYQVRPVAGRGNEIFRLKLDLATLLKSDTAAIAEVNSTSSDDSPVVSSDEKILVFASDRSGATKVYTSTREAATKPFGAPSLVGGLEAVTNPKPMWMTPDGCRLYIRGQFAGANHLLVANRKLN